MTGQPCCSDHEAPDSRADKEYPLPSYVAGGNVPAGSSFINSSPDCIFPIPEALKGYFTLKDVTGFSIEPLPPAPKYQLFKGAAMNPAQKFLKDRETLEAILTDFHSDDTETAEAILTAGWTAPDEV